MIMIKDFLNFSHPLISKNMLTTGL